MCNYVFSLIIIETFKVCQSLEAEILLLNHLILLSLSEHARCDSVCVCKLLSGLLSVQKWLSQPTVINQYTSSCRCFSPLSPSFFSLLCFTLYQLSQSLLQMPLPQDTSTYILWLADRALE